MPAFDFVIVTDEDGTERLDFADDDAQLFANTLETIKGENKFLPLAGGDINGVLSARNTDAEVSSVVLTTAREEEFEIGELQIDNEDLLVTGRYP